LLTDDFEPASALVRADIAARSDRGRILKDIDDHYLGAGFEPATFGL